MEKYREGKRDLHCIYVVEGLRPRSEVWKCLKIKEVDKKNIRLIKAMYENSRTKVRYAVGTTTDFKLRFDSIKLQLLALSCSPF